MGGHLAAVDRIFLTHPLLDKGMAGAGHHRDAACRLHQLLGIPDQTRIMEDLAARLLGQQLHGQQTDNIIALNKIALGIPEKTAVKIAVPGNAYIGAMLAHQSSGLFPFFREQGIGNAIGEGAVRLVKGLDKGKG